MQKDDSTIKKRITQNVNGLSGMSAILYREYSSDPSVLVKESNIPISQLNEEKDEVLIRVNFAALNPVDYKIRSGYLKLFYKALFPIIPGQDVSGVVLRSNSKRFAPGDRVMGLLENGGAFAEYVKSHVKQLAKVPQEMSLAEAACLPTVALATQLALVQVGKLKAMAQTMEQGKDKKSEQNKPRILILGSSGGVGSFAIQYAKRILNAEVHAVCSSINVDYVKSLGADYVYDYSSDANFNQLIPKGLDIIMDNVGNDELRKKTWKLLKKGHGKYILVGVINEPMTYLGGSKLGASMAWHKFTSFLHLTPSFHVISTRSDGPLLEKIINEEYLPAHMSPGYITRCYPFTEKDVQTGYRLLETRRTRGKILVQVADSLSEEEAIKSELFLRRFNQHVFGLRNINLSNLPSNK
jgi:NADPH:quinone reductase-like Zn-dependent oxidoreductase